jgi:peptide/nickel transport system substrate-binding protein
VMPSVNLYRTDNIPGPDNGFAGQNYPGYSNPEYDKVAAAAMQEIDRQKQIPLYHEAFKIWSAELPVMPLFARVKVGATRTNITGYVIDPTENSEMYNIANFDIE